jgi:hypothetical protein
MSGNGFVIPRGENISFVEVDGNRFCEQSLRMWGLSAIRAGRKKRVGNSRCSASGGCPIMNGP